MGDGRPTQIGDTCQGASALNRGRDVVHRNFANGSNGSFDLLIHRSACGQHRKSGGRIVLRQPSKQVSMPD